MDLFEPWRNQPPARYLLESDSEDEVDPEDVHQRRQRHVEDSDEANGSAAPSRAKASRAVDVRSTGEQQHLLEGHSLLVAVDEGGRSWAAGFDPSALSDNGEIIVAGAKIASISQVESAKTSIVFLAADLGYDEMQDVAEQLLLALKPTSITVIDSYSVPAYLSDSSSSSTPVLRYLSSSEFQEVSGLAPLEPPNMVQGIAAAIAGQAVEGAIPCLLVLLPSYASSSSTSSTLSQASRHGLPAETIYDYGGPSPNASTPLALPENKAAMRELGARMGWTTKLGWQAERAVNAIADASKLRRGKTDPALPGSSTGYGWWKPQRPVGEREIGEGGMYM